MWMGWWGSKKFSDMCIAFWLEDGRNGRQHTIFLLKLYKSRRKSLHYYESLIFKFIKLFFFKCVVKILFFFLFLFVGMLLLHNFALLIFIIHSFVTENLLWSYEYIMSFPLNLFIALFIFIMIYVCTSSLHLFSFLSKFFIAILETLYCYFVLYVANN